MAMNVLQSPSRPGLGKVSGFFWRNPGLGLFLLLLGPLMWFGIVYFGSLLILLWQGFYTFDDFTMSVTPELTLANIRALFNPANYDIILRTLTMLWQSLSPAPFWLFQWRGIWRAIPAGK